MYIPKKRPGMFGNVGRYEPAPGTIEEMPRQPAIDEAPGLGMRGAPMQDDGRPHGLRRVAGIFADALAGAAGRPGPYAAMLHERQQQAAELAAEQRKRSLERDDYIWKQEYEAAHPKAEAPDAFERALRGAGIDPASEQGRGLYQGRAESMARDPNDEFVVVPIPGVGTYAGPRSGLSEAMGGGSQPRNLGPVVDSIPGGPTPPASDTFRDAFRGF